MKRYFFLILWTVLIGCATQKKDKNGTGGLPDEQDQKAHVHTKVMISDTNSKNMKEHKFTNKLISESSPYLLQHAHNPVNWYPWGEEALKKAKEEDKLLLISIGYAACHWCHVMEHESFEDPEVAEIMNKHYVCIKVDREERPDIDQVYMNAVQLLTGRGGWPLNAFALPDGRTVHGGTYFPKQNWLQVLHGLNQVYQEDRGRIEKAAAEIQRGVALSEVIAEKADKSPFTEDLFKELLEPWKRKFDKEWGGYGSAPKFPLPNSLQYLLRHYFYTKDNAVLEHVQLTLDRMAHGGIYDHIGGGFARYSVDEYWKVPHFEKMLYDNGQLISLYSDAYRLTNKTLYRKVIEETVAFVERELMSDEGGFYSSLDADSEGVEGKYYIFTQAEFEALLSKEEKELIRFYSIEQDGNWEHGNNVLFVMEDEVDFAQNNNMTEQEFFNLLGNFKQRVLPIREQRIRPGLDDKILVSWNALMIKGLVDAYKALGNEVFLKLALKNAEFIEKKLMKDNYQLYRNYKNGKASINAFLDDYAFLMDAFLSLNQVTGDEKWVAHSIGLKDYVFAHFFDQKSGMFFFTSDLDSALVARKMELNDGVLPASNSTMALNLYVLGSLTYDDELLGKAEQMLLNIKEHIPQAAEYYSQWAILQAYLIKAPYEVAVVGKEAGAFALELMREYRPDLIFAVANSASDLPILKEREVEGKTKIYVCKDRVCKLPVENVSAAKQQLLR